MDGIRESIRRQSSKALAGISVWAWVGLALVGAGCGAEHRVSLGEFMGMQEAHLASLRQAAKDRGPVDVDQHLGPYRVGPGDVLTIVLTGGELAGPAPRLQVRVDRNGEIELPIVGVVKVGAMELEDVETTIKNAYAPNVYKDVVCHAVLSSVRSTKVLVVGAVTTPGLVSLRRTERNMLFAVVGAGGVSEFASGRASLRRVRSPDEEVTLDLTDPVDLSTALALAPLQDGDIVHMHASKTNTIFVGGLVNRPGPQMYQPEAEMNVLQVLAAAHGTRTDVAPKYATLVRRNPDGKDVHVKLNLDRVATGQDPNIQLAGGDILWVPETFQTNLRDFLNRNIFMRAGISVTYNVTGLDFINRRKLQTARGGGNTLQDTFDPLGFLTQNTLLQGIGAQTAP